MLIKEYNLKGNRYPIHIHVIAFDEGERIQIRSFVSDAIRFQPWFGPTSASTSCYRWWHGN